VRGSLEGMRSMKVKWLIAAAAAVGLATVTFPVMSGCGSPDTSPAGAARTQPVASHEQAAAAVCGGDAKPANLDFTLTDMNGKKVNLADFK
jgi:cytochrome oxidase Cu insertion factor (SCO1/SenC/PrrC family)